MSQLESLETVRALRLLPDNVKNGIHELSTLCVVTLGPVVAGSRLSKHKVVWSKDLTIGAGPDAVHGAGLEVDEDGPGHVLAATGLVVVDVDPLKLEVGVAMVGAGGVDAVLVADDLPELEREGGVIVDAESAFKRGSNFVCSRV